MVALELMQRIPLFRSLRPEEQKRIAPLLFRRTYGAGEMVYAEGSAAGSVAFLIHGLVSFRRKIGAHAEPVTLATLREEGAILGWSAVIGHSHLHSHGAVCVEETEVVEMDGRRFLHLLREHPEMGVRILEKLSTILADRLNATREQIGRRSHAGVISHG